MLREIGADVRGICTRPYIIGITGNLIYKALKKRLVSGVILLGTLFYLGNRAFQFDIQGTTIATATLALAVAGFAAQKWGSWAMQRSLMHAEAHGANLLENKKKKRFIQIYLPQVYEHVYAPEAGVHFDRQALEATSKRHEELFKHLLLDRLRRYGASAQTRTLLETPSESCELVTLPNLTASERSAVDPGLLDQDGRVSETMLRGAWLDLGEFVVRANEVLMSSLGFEAALRYALVRSDRQRDERADLGIDLAFLEDYLDGACFHPNNTKIIEQSQHSLMRQIEVQFCRPALTDKVRNGLRRMLQKRWHTYINTSVQASVGNLLYRISEEFGTHRLAVEDILWCDDHGRKLLRRHLLTEFEQARHPEQIADQIIGRLDEGAARILKKIFHNSATEAQRLVRREYGYSVELSVLRRICYDHQYLIGELPSTPMDDLSLVGAAQRSIDLVQAAMKRARDDLKRFHRRIHQEDVKDHWLGYTPEMRRALEVAYFTDTSDFRRAVDNTPEAGTEVSLATIADRLAEQFTAEASEKLRRLRLHHQLALIEYVDTLRQLDELVYHPTGSKTAPVAGEEKA